MKKIIIALVLMALGFVAFAQSAVWVEGGYLPQTAKIEYPEGAYSELFLFNWRENIKEKYFSDGAIVIKTTKEKWKYDIIRYCLK